jgi:TRAP-type uncharacterized transport system substrate-binding protein
MTANELADKLQNEKAKTLLYVATIVDSANMLRQQQAEIESLKMRELTDEEIAEIYHSEPRFSPQGNFAYLNFARAILKRASEK